MLRKLVALLLSLAFTAPAFAADQTIDALTAGAVLVGTEKIPMFQTANPAVTTTPTAIKTYISTGGTVTTSNPVLSLTQTWNAGAVAFTGLLFNVTNTTSATASLLVDLQVGGSSKFNVDKAGNISAVGATNPFAQPFNVTVNSQTLRFSNINSIIMIEGTAADQLSLVPIGVNGSTAALVSNNNNQIFVSDTNPVQFATASQWTANGTATVTISALAPAGVTTATIKKWFTVKDNAGTTVYIPAWGA